MRLHGTRRIPPARLAAPVFAVALVLSACGGDDGDTDSNNDGDAAQQADGDGDAVPDDVQLRFSWWGSDSRHEQTQEIIDLFEDEHPHISIVPDFTDWDSYWDRLATSTAGGDSPDIMTQEERYMTDYALRGQLLDLGEVAGTLDLSEIEELALGGGQIDGAQYAVPTGVNAFTVVANRQVFDEAGVDLPDDTAWTWQDFSDIVNEIGASGDLHGFQPEQNEAGLNVYARQRGEALYNADGTLGISAQTLADFWQLQLDLMEEGSTPSQTELLELAGPDMSLVATDQGAMGFWWTNQLGALDGVAEGELELLRMPGEFENQQPGMYLKPAMFYSISAHTDHPEEAALFVDFLLNDVRAAEIMLTDRGLPANLRVRDEILPLLPDTEEQVSDFMTEITPDLADPPPPPPHGAGEIPEINTRLWEEALFDRLTPEEAAQQFIDEASIAIGS
ncbi:ABC transporter substrate-binding protein [Phytoactinopolyspora mesophila]|uniref:Extracellular solute-binding protein n=1 Tax=Phytoactinopolyspora mesophila TaxID=2650750 RepID=A0A7K3M221_9ACTN|nr:extracellular solute-binding protein [Phytoactinopolyspora mesophila]NDL57345.1 extracellular solute-binding protein [Phytoactinopolyspora mesophila]